MWAQRFQLLCVVLEQVSTIFLTPEFHDLYWLQFQKQFHFNLWNPDSTIIPLTPVKTLCSWWLRKKFSTGSIMGNWKVNPQLANRWSDHVLAIEKRGCVRVQEKKDPLVNQQDLMLIRFSLRFQLELFLNDGARLHPVRLCLQFCHHSIFSNGVQSKGDTVKIQKFLILWISLISSHLFFFLIFGLTARYAGS